MENDDKKILMKAVLVIGLHGLLRRNELTDLTFEDITRKNEYFEFIIRKSKTDKSGKGFKFFVSGYDYKFVDKYVNCFTSREQNGRLFRYIVKGSGTKKVVG